MNRLALGFVGDVCLAGDIRSQIAATGPAHCFELVQSVFASRDLVCGNLECCIVERESEETPKNVMHVSSALAAGLERAGIGVWSLSNNHVMDAGSEGLAATERFLDERRLRHFGAGVDLPAAERDAAVDVRGRRVIFIGACDVPRYFASPLSAGVAPLDETRLLRRVAAARTEADVVVCSMHADLEFSDYPAPGRVRLARALIDHGADLVIQHHPHVCQGVERHGEGVIAYSLGNFVFPVTGNAYQERHAATGWGVVLCVDVEWNGDKKSIAWRAEPVTLGRDNRPAPSQGAIRVAQLAALDRVSERLADPSLLRREWWKRCVQEARSTYYVLYHQRRRAGLRAALADAFDIVRDPYEQRWIRGLLSGGTAG